MLWCKRKVFNYIKYIFKKSNWLAHILHPATVGGTSGSYSSSSGVYLGEDSSGGGDALSRYLDAEGYGSGGGGGGSGGGSSSYMVSSVSKVKSSSSSGGARRVQAGGSSGGLSPGFRERKIVTSHSGGYDGERPPMKTSAAWFVIAVLVTEAFKKKTQKRRKPSCMRVLLTFVLLLCFILGSSSANSSPELTRKDYGIYCKWDWQHCEFFILSHYRLFFQLYPLGLPVCVCIYVFPFLLCFLRRLERHKREEWKPRYSATVCFCFFSSPPPLSHSSLFLPDLPLKRPCFCFIKSGFFCVCVCSLWFFFPPSNHHPLHSHRERDQSQVTERLPHGRQM